jgi:hypothetical protein
MKLIAILVGIIAIVLAALWGIKDVLKEIEKRD